MTQAALQEVGRTLVWSVQSKRNFLNMRVFLERLKSTKNERVFEPENNGLGTWISRGSKEVQVRKVRFGSLANYPVVTCHLEEKRRRDKED